MTFEFMEFNKWLQSTNFDCDDDMTNIAEAAWNAAIKVCQHRLAMTDWDFSCCFPHQCLEDLKTK